MNGFIGVSPQMFQEFSHKMEVEKEVQEYFDLTNCLIEKTAVVRTSKLTDVAFFALMAVQLLFNDIYIGDELSDVKERINNLLIDALEEAGYEVYS